MRRKAVQKLIIKLQEPENKGRFRLEFDEHEWQIGFSGPAGKYEIYSDEAVDSLNELLKSLKNDVGEALLKQSFPKYLRRLREENHGLDRTLALYFRMTVPSKGPPEEDDERMKRLREELTAQELVEFTKPALGTQPALITQDYVGPGGEPWYGVNARFSWEGAVPGGRGSNVQVCLIDDGWDSDHEDLDQWRVKYVPDTGPGTKDHGTRCLGILMAKPPNGTSAQADAITGIAHELRKCWVASTTGFSGQLPETIEWALAAEAPVEDSLDSALGAQEKILHRGDVFLIPKETKTPPAKPVEADPDVRECLRTAAEVHGMIMVEAAGNSGQDLDTFPNEIFDGCAAVPEHSHAIIVGAGHPPDPAAGADPPLSRMDGSSYGGRVDCQGWGERIASTQVSQLPEKYSLFHGTSGAASMVAGVVAVVQSVRKEVFPNNPIPPLEMRHALRATGTPQQGDLAEHIGSLPEIRELLQYFSLLPDAYIRDHLGDQGDRNTGDFVWRSPDIVTRKEVLMDPAGALLANLNMDFGQPLQQDTPSFVYLRVLNRGLFEWEGTVRLYEATQGALVGAPEVEVLEDAPLVVPKATGDPLDGTLEPAAVVFGPVEWTPPPIGLSPVLVAVLDSHLDPAPSVDTVTNLATYEEFVALNNNVAHRDLKVLQFA